MANKTILSDKFIISLVEDFDRFTLQFYDEF